MSTSRENMVAIQSRKLPQKDARQTATEASKMKSKNGDHLFKQIKQSLQSRDYRARSLLRESGSNSNMRSSVVP